MDEVDKTTCRDIDGAAHDPDNHRMGRPLAAIDEDEVARLGYEGCSNRDLAALLRVHHQTIANRFSPLLAKKRAERRLNIRRLQWEAAMKGNARVLIWLGKVELGQSG
jgi:hypothetical protein